jgi:hypothetical protein
MKLWLKTSYAATNAEPYINKSHRFSQGFAYLLLAIDPGLQTEPGGRRADIDMARLAFSILEIPPIQHLDARHVGIIAPLHRCCEGGKLFLLL